MRLHDDEINVLAEIEADAWEEPGRDIPTVAIAVLVRQIIAEADDGRRCAACHERIALPAPVPGKRLCDACTAAGHPIERDPPF